MNKRLHTNNINSICDSAGIWHSDRSDISNILTEHFKNISTTSNPCFPDDAFDIIPAIFADVDNDFLIAMPTDDEIENVVKSMPAWSSPGPDGFQAGFYQTP